MCPKCTFFLESAKILLMNENFPISEEVSVATEQETLLAEILVNQQKILENQRLLLRAERNRRIWGIAKTVILAVLIFAPLFFLPAMISSMMGGMIPDVGSLSEGGLSLGGINLDAILGNTAALEELLGN